MLRSFTSLLADTKEASGSFFLFSVVSLFSFNSVSRIYIFSVSW